MRSAYKPAVVKKKGFKITFKNEEIKTVRNISIVILQWYSKIQLLLIYFFIFFSYFFVKYYNINISYFLYFYYNNNGYE